MNLEILAETAKQIQEINAPNLSIPALVFITDITEIPNPEAIIKKLPKPTLVIIRDYNIPNRSEYANITARECKLHNQPFLIAGDIGLAIESQSNGIHLSTQNINLAAEIRKNHSNWIITGSVHNIEQISYANNLPLDILFLSPIFTTQSHQDIAPIGISAFNNIATKSSIPVYALGGINKSNYHLLYQSKASGISSIRAFL